MWRTLASILGLDADDDDDDNDEEEEETSTQDFTASSSQPASEEQREFIGIVTSLHSAYGLINHEICFTADVVGGSMPSVGDKVHVVACRKNAVGGWRAKRVWLAPADDFTNEPQMAESCQQSSIPSSSSDVKAALLVPEHDCRELLNNKDGISVTECIDFGNMQLGDSSSLSIVIRYSHVNLLYWLCLCDGYGHYVYIICKH